MITVLPEFTINLEHFSGYKVVCRSWGWLLLGFLQGEWRELYVSQSEEKVREQKALLDEAIIIANAHECPGCGENEFAAIGLRFVEECNCSEGICRPDEVFCKDPDCCGEGDCCTP